MKEKIREFLEKFKKINLPDFDIIKLKLLAYKDKIKAGKQIKKSLKAKTVQAPKKPSKLDKYFNKYTIFYFLLFIICLNVFVFFAYLVKGFFLANEIEETAKERVLAINLNYATNKLVKKVKQKKIKKRNLRKFIKELNLFDKEVGYYRLNPCDKDILAFGEHPTIGNVSIEAPDFHTLVITANNCDGKEYMSKTISLNEKEYSLQDEIDFIRSEQERKLKIAKIKKRLAELSKAREASKKEMEEKQKGIVTDKKIFKPIEELDNKTNKSDQHSESDHIPSTKEEQTVKDHENANSGESQNHKSVETGNHKE